MRKFAFPFVVLGLLTLGVAGSRAQGIPTIFINEIHYDNAGTDVGEFVEIAGPAGTNLSGYSLVLYNGNNATAAVPYSTTPLSGTIPPQQGGYGTLAFLTPGLQNGPRDGIALVQGTTVHQLLSYQGVFTAASAGAGGGVAAGMTSTDIGVSQASAPAIGLTLQLTGTGSGASAFTWVGPTAGSQGARNAGQTFTGTPSTLITISDATVTEGGPGATPVATFTVNVSGSHPSGVTFDIATADGAGLTGATAASGDYVSKTLIGQSIASEASSYTFAVTVNGDATVENDETFFVNLTNVVGAEVGDGQGTGTIANDDAMTSDVVISQVYGGGGNGTGENAAPYSHDFIELFNRGAAPVNLAGWSVQYQSATGSTPWQVTPLSGMIAPGGYFLIQQATNAPVGASLPASDASGSIALAAGAGKVALLNTTAASSGACPTITATFDLVGYGAASCDEGAGTTGAPSNTTSVLRKRGGCLDTNNNNADFLVGAPLPRNSASPARSCTFQTVAIHDIQGAGAVTPLLGVDVQADGIVTAKKSNGFFMQTAGDDDANPATSQGIFVFTQSAPSVTVGNVVTAQGTATEFFNLTQIESSVPSDVIVHPGGVQPLPAPITLTTAILDPNADPDALERFEGMRLHAGSLVSVGPTNEFGEILAVLPGVDRPMREPGIERSLPIPVDPTTELVDCCIPIWDENPERIMIDTDGLAGSTRVNVTSNVTLTGVTGPLDFAFSAYKVLPETTPVASPNMAAVPVPVPDADELTVAGFNIEHFDNNPTQRAKAALAIRNVMHSPDVIGHVEILDLASLQALAQQVNDDAAAFGENPGYQAYLVPGPVPGSTQHIGFLVKSSRVEVVSTTQYFADHKINGAFLHDRPPFVLRANALLPGRAPRLFIVVVNHLRSFIDIELTTDEGARVRAKRTLQAEETAGLLQQLQADNPGVPVISVGDYNAYQFNDGYTDPIAILKGSPTADDEIVVDASEDVVNPNFINLMDSLPIDQQYSFVFEGTPQALDHVLLNQTAASLNTRFAIARNNADFPEGAQFANDVTRPERNSDHDMPVAYFRFPLTANLTATVTGGGSTQTGSTVGYSVNVTNNGPEAATNLTVSAPTTAGLQFNGVTAPAGWTCVPTAGGVTCTAASLAAGANATIVLSSIVSCSLPDATVLTQSISASATELDQNGADNTAIVTVTAVNPAPVISGVLSPIVVFPTAGTTPPGAVVSNAQLGSPVASDNCSATIVRTGVPAGNTFPVGNTTVTYTATDSGGATATASQIVTVLSGTDTLESVAADLRAILATASQKGPLKARAADALKKVEKAIAELSETPADTQHAAISISQAMQQIEGLLNQGALPPAVANSLLQRLAGVKWLIS